MSLFNLQQYFCASLSCLNGSNLWIWYLLISISVFQEIDAIMKIKINQAEAFQNLTTPAQPLALSLWD